MKVVILAGGLGTRMSEETKAIPKPMVKIGDKPIIWHIMKTYSHYGFNDFIICLGYKGYVIKEYFANYFLHTSDVTINMEDNSMDVHNSASEPWKVTLVETGLNTMTAGRVKKIQRYTDNKPFMLTYGDGVSDINIKELIREHKKSNSTVTLTAVEVDSRFGKIEIENDNKIKQFIEKPKFTNEWINGGYLVCNPDFFEYITGSNEEILEKKPLEKLTKDNKLSAYKHKGFWKPMDTLRDNIELNSLWDAGKAPWKIWKD